jgi:hypothetical protein
MSKTIATKSLLLAILVAGLALSRIAQAADSAKDPGNGLPLAPGLIAGGQPIKATICKKQANIKRYHVSFGLNDTAAESVSWYKAHLPGYHYFHQIWLGRPQELFYSPDGTKGVNIVGNSNNDKVLSISYLSIHPGLTEHEMAAFSPTNASCK